MNGERAAELRRAWARRMLFLAALLLAWAGLAELNLWPEYVLPSPLAVAETFVAGMRSGVFVLALGVSARRIAVGYALSLAIGLTLGLLLGRVRILRDTVGSLVVGLQALPSVSWLPLALLWFGLNDAAIIFVVVMGALFSIVQGVEAGVLNTPPQYVKAARVLGARGLALYTEVVLPAALPSVLSGLKQGWAFAWRSLMAGELLFYTISLGNLLQVGRDLNDTAQVIAVMFLIVIVGMVVDQLVFAPAENAVRRRWGLGG
ncbi:MAG: ABC transporter permease [Thermoflexales bacterium]|nr:ABC transporter permease [Thermoflexales bacterium]